jgi:hypothetical protein
MYTEWRGPDIIGPPIPWMLKRVQRWLEEGQDVRIFTARVSESHPDEERRVAQEAIEHWCEHHLGRLLLVTYKKDAYMIEFWDDRAIQVIPNTGARADGKDYDE